MRFENGLLNNEIIKKEMLSFAPLCIHENAQNCLLIGDNSLSADAGKLIKNISSLPAMNSKIEFESETFDIVVSFDDSANLQEVFRVLKKDGIFCSKIGVDIQESLTKLGQYYRIVMPYHNMELVFASNKYHPTADLLLDKSDFIENVEYYNSEVHLASFAIYERAKQNLKGIIKG